MLHGLRDRVPIGNRTALIAAHPDDETIGAGASLHLFQRLLLVHVTDGAPRNLADARAAGFETAAEYARARRGELSAAMQAGGAAPSLAELHAPDQGASARMAALAHALTMLFAQHAIETVITHPYEGGHPDHDATACAVHAAARRCAARPDIVEFASYHAAADGGMAAGCFLPHGAPATVVDLTEAEQAIKRRMLDCFVTQRATLAPFGVTQESFRPAPAYDFGQPPHAGTLHYERHDWGMTGAAWRRLARGVKHPLTVLSVAYALAPVGPDAVGGAEQVLATLDRALTDAGHRSLVVACRGSHAAGTWFDTGVDPQGAVDEAARSRAQQAARAAAKRVLRQARVDVLHMHGLDFAETLPADRPPTLVTLHLPPAWYPALPALPGLWFNCVSASQEAACPPGAAMSAPIVNGVDVAYFAAARHARRSYALMLGRVCPEKGQHLALQAAHRAGTTLLIGGAVFPYPEHQAYFAAEVAPLLDRQRRFLGPVGLARKRRLLSAAACLLVPSLAPETSSLVAMEALACGTPVIAYPSGALAHIVEHGRTGYLADSVAGMADAFRRVATIDPADCREAARTRFSRDRMVATYFDRYRDLAGQPACAA